MFDYETKHEIFRLLATVAPLLSPAARHALLEAVVEGPPHGDGDSDPERRFDNRAIFDRLEWLKRYALDWDELDQAIETLLTLEPDMEVRPHPDHDTWMESGTWGEKPPVTVEEFVNLIESDGPWRAISAITARDYTERSFNEPTWDDAVQLIKETATAHPDAALLLHSCLTITPLRAHQDLISACIYGWADASLDAIQLEAVLSILEAIELPTDLVRPISAFILRAAKKLDKKASTDRLARLDHLAREVWANHAVAFSEPGWSDSLLRGLNTWPGFLAQYWIQRISLRWQAEPDQWSGLRSIEEDALSAMLPSAGSSHAANAALGIIAADFAFLFSADRRYATERLVPLFDTATSNVAPEAWFSFLHNPRTSPEMLDSGFWQLLLAAESTATSLEDRNISEQYWRLIASIAAFSTAAVVDRNELVGSLMRRSDQGPLIYFLRTLGSILHSEKPQAAVEIWDKWLGAIMTQRYDLPAGMLSQDERAAWGDLALDLGLNAAIELSARIPGPITGRTRFNRVSEQFALASPTLLISLAQLRLQVTEIADWHVQNELSELVQRVGHSADPTAISALVETALLKGVGDALNWVRPV